MLLFIKLVFVAAIHQYLSPPQWSTIIRRIVLNIDFVLPIVQVLVRRMLWYCMAESVVVTTPVKEQCHTNL